MQRLLWLGLAALGAVAGVVVLSSAASAFVDGWPPLPAGLAVGVGAASLAVLLPAGIGRLLVGALRSRGREVRALPLMSGLVAATNVGWVVLVQLAGPAPLARLLPERGTWLVDVVSGRGPFGPAAVPVVERQAREIHDQRQVDAFAAAACDRTARALAVGIASELGDVPGVARVMERHGVKPGSALDAVPEGVGRPLLADVLDVASGAIPLVDLPELPATDLAPIAAHRTRIQLATQGWEGRYEDGAWRVCTGTDSDELERGHTLVKVARARARAAEPANVQAPSWDAPVREALRAAVKGRTGFALGVPPAAGWSEAFTSSAAVVQARRVLAWCEPIASADPSHVAQFDLLTQKWSIHDTSPEATARLETDGRTFLEDVSGACAPVARDHVATELARGFSASVQDRARWVALDVSQVDHAQLAALSPLEVKAELPGATVRVVDDAGTWRVDWR